ncbi:hypothetical protein D1610_11390 [Sphingomonas gilva]|uniref:Alpha/beta hydrolase n=1 Tax=Sphingomonas gilva TaxID=2305907 RepID=A0A396RLF8_9SPHN|nr:hypothetical protein [Sphingomonas gilva]RHW17148.1 hypothetical protein D1610_11390 [Sphingomonas gilva]
MTSHYDWRGGREAMMRFGLADAPVVVIAPPPFEEANRLRALMATVARGLARQGLAAVIPDLPGTGESLTDIAATRLADWRDAFAAANEAAGPVRLIASVRAGALFDGGQGAVGHWRLTPQDGSRLLRELVRTRIAGLREDGREASSATLTEIARNDGIELSGHWFTPALFGDLEEAAPLPAHPLRTVRLDGDAQPADHRLAAAPLWRRAEPGNDLELAQLVADDIADWMRTCLGG